MVATHCALRIALTVGISLAIASSAQAAKVHLVTIADTLDPSIGKSVEVDQRSVGFSFHYAITLPGALDVSEINGNNCRREVILRTIAELSVAPDDAVVVFYAGHGANDPRLGQYLHFPRIRGYVTRNELITAIRAKRARLSVVSTDCCNSSRKIPTRLNGAPQARPEPIEQPRIKSHYRALFFDTAGFVDLTSSKPGEVSVSYPALVYNNGKEYYGRGGLWTTSLLSVIDGLRGRVASWAEVTDVAAKATAHEFQDLIPDGLDNPADPARPQMTQTAVVSLNVRVVRPTAPDPDVIPVADPPFPPMDGMIFAARPFQRLGIHGYESPGQDGLFIYATQPGSPAARLGLERNDVILAINDNKVRTAKGFHKTLLQAEGVARLTYRDVRTGRVMTSVLRLDDREESPTRGRGPGNGRPAFGAAATAVAGGVRVDGVAPGSPSELAGLDPGDIITEINGRPVATVADYFAAVAASPDEMDFTVLNSRTGQKQGMIVTLDRQ